MGWRSENAQKAALKYYDTHKTWQMIVTFHIATLLELVRPYVIKCIELHASPSPQGFIDFGKSTDDTNYAYLLSTVTRYTQGIYNFRMGIRRNNNTLAQSAKHMTKELFHGRNHPRYQQIEMIESFQLSVMPDKIREFTNTFYSLSKSGSPSNGQGFDFVLEEENKMVKSWIRHGVPTENTWLSIIRNTETLKTVRNNVMTYLKLDQEGSDKLLDLQDAIAEWRITLREMKYINCNKLVHTSITGIELDPEVMEFTFYANRKRNYRILEGLLDQPSPELDLNNPVCVTKEERAHACSLNNKIIQQIDTMIISMIDSMPNELHHQRCLSKLQKLKHKKKDAHIALLNAICEEIQDDEHE